MIGAGCEFGPCNAVAVTWIEITAEGLAEPGRGMP